MTQSDSLSLSATPSIPTRIIQRISLRFGGDKAKELERFLKFCVVGVIGTVIDLGLTNILLIFVFHVKPGPDAQLEVQLAGGIGFTIAVFSNFMWNRYWTYPESRSKPIAPQLAQFFIVNAAGLLIREIILAIFSNPFAALAKQVGGGSMSADVPTKIGANMALILSVAIVMFWNFFVNRKWTYKDVK